MKQTFAISLFALLLLACNNTLSDSSDDMLMNEIEGMITNVLRLPLVKASKTLANKLTALYNEFRG